MKRARLETVPGPGDAATPAGLPGFRDVTQVAVIAHDARRTVEAIGQALGAGSFKFVTLRPPELFNTTYGGEPADGSMKVGITWIGDMQVEVIEPLSDRNVFSDYLRRRDGKAGIQHIYLQVDDLSYAQAIEAFENAGYPPKQHGQLNASGRFGFLPVPAMPGFLATRIGTRFCYTSSYDALKLDIELAKFPFGLSHRMGLRMAAPQEWIPPTGRKHFESLPSDAVIRNIDAVYVLGENIEAMTAAYAKLAQAPIGIGRYADDVLPGTGRWAQIRLASTAIFLVEPETGPLKSLLRQGGDGIRILRGRAKGSRAPGRLRARGWIVEAHGKALLATHDAVPFALWVTSHDD